MSDDKIIKLAAQRRVATRAGALRFNKSIGAIIGADVAKDNKIDRSATLQRLLSLYNRMRAAKLYGQEEDFKKASAEMADAIDSYSQRAPGGADKIRDIVKKLTFSDEEAKRRKAIDAKNKKTT